MVANGLTLPRGIAFDSEGGLLVVEMGVGISRVRLRSPRGCVQVDGAVGRVVEDGAVSLWILYFYDFDSIDSLQLP